jgi:hypothetical protein
MRGSKAPIGVENSGAYSDTIVSEAMFCSANEGCILMLPAPDGPVF